MAPPASIRLFGRVLVQLDEAGTGTLRSGRAEVLLAYLLVRRGEAVSRERLAALLWPDSGASQARTNLRHLLHTVHRDVPASARYLDVTARTVCWRAETPLWLDVAVFEQLLEAVDAVDRITALREAVGLYRGQLVDGCDDEWLREERERLRRRYREALRELAALAEAGGDEAEAIGLAERMVSEDPLAEDAYRLLIRLHGRRGDRTSALRAYHQCVTTLEQELGVEPSPETQRAYRELIASPDGVPRIAVRAVGSPLVGRTAERARLVEVWRAAEAGRARGVLVTGEAGIGKTRLVEEFRAWCVRRGALAADARCYVAEGPLAYGPVADWLRRPALRAAVRGLDRARLTELSRLLPELLDEIPRLPRPQALPEAEQRHRLFDAVAAAVLTAGRPVLLIVDDLPHVDRETGQLLHFLLRYEPSARLLVVATARTEDLDLADHLRDVLAGLREQGLLAEFELGRLTPGETATLAERLTGARPPEQDARRLHQQTEGNPLFVVEALRAGRAAGSELTPRVQALIETRLAQLGEPARTVLEVAAAIGREFPTDVLVAASGVDEETLVSGLDELWRRRIVRDHGADARAATYDFTHDRIREVAYRSLSPPRRRMLHRRIAAALEDVHRGSGPASAQIAAQHELAGAITQAIAWYARAAEGAQLLHANARAVELLDRALGLIGSLPASPDRDRLELELRTAALAPLVPLAGYTSREITEMQRRASALARGLGVEPAPPLLRSLALDALTRADFAAAAGYGRRLRSAGERRGEDVLLVEGDYVLGIAAFWQADLDAARRHFEGAVRRYRPSDRTAHLTHYGQDPKVVCLGRLACTYWFLDLPEAARDAHAAALAWSREIAHPFSHLVALTFGAVLAVDMDDEAEVRRLTAELVATGSGGMNQNITRGFAGYVAVLDGEVRAGLDLIHAAVREAAAAPVAPGQHAMTLRLLLAAQLAAGDRAAALAVAERLLAMGGPARLWTPLAERVRADLACSPDGAGAEGVDNGDGTPVERPRPILPAMSDGRRMR